MSRLVVLALALAACAPALSSFQPAHVAPKGHVGIELGVDVSVPTGTIGKVVDAGQALANAASDRALTDDERDTVIEAGATLALAPPAPVTHLGATYVPAAGWELGLRFQSGGWRVGMRHQLLRQEDSGVDLTVGIGASRFAYEFPVSDVLGILELDDFTRYSFDLPIVVGQHTRIYRWWAGPRLVFDTYGSSLTFTQPAIGGSPDATTLASIDGKSAFVGGQVGFAIGFARVFVALELTIVKLSSTAHLAILDATRDFDIGGVVIYPGLAITGDI
ncbi:MAG: hypothetical protein NT062_09895 [Proteobacteria bacterium]|nr:hypothetical protein [Pseudomonadota bacterium]